MYENDHDAIAACLAGKRQAFETLVEKYARRMYTVAYRFMQNHEDTRDVVQESFVAAYNALDRFDQSRKFVTWLLAITTKQSLYRLRQRKTVSRHTVPLEEDRIANGSLPETILERREQQRNIEETISALEPKYRSVLVLRHFEHLSYDEIAATLDLPLGTVKTTLFRARKMFAKLLRQREEGSG
jgi:RNA polymerase sigma-70 factor (ECF subfamily)